MSSAPADAAVTGPLVGVIGLGNVLMGDDAFGPWVVALLLAEHEFRPEVSVLDLGTPGLDLLPYVADLEALVLVDTVRAAAPAGTLRLYGRAALGQRIPKPRLSPHDPGVAEALESACFAGREPRHVLLVGAVPQHTHMGVGLSPALRAAVPAAAEAVLRELERLGRPARRRQPSARPDVWWEADPSTAGARP